ncbi:MAG TPA: TetR/AcrR family transcriptional regulator [Acidimicrobiales bacterium]|nr:TetR/AcrR family transcriptional regulator [Acidimicrobiales bacterium]
MTDLDTFTLVGREGRRPRGHTDRQSELLDALEEVFFQEGFTHLTIGEMVSRLRCSRRTIYSLAPSREELILIVVDRLLHRIGREAHAAAAACGDPSEAIEAYLARSVTTLARATPAFNSDVDSYLPTRQLYDRHLGVALRELAGFVRDGVENGIFRPLNADVIAEVLAGVAERIRRPEVLGRVGVTHDEALALLGDLMRRGMLVDGSSTMKGRRGGSRGS